MRFFKLSLKLGFLPERTGLFYASVLQKLEGGGSELSSVAALAGAGLACLSGWRAATADGRVERGKEGERD